MCTAITYQTKDFYFGRNLDLEYSFNETVTVTPRKYPFHFRNGTVLNDHYAMIGMATVDEGYPLYYEATNEKGLSLAGLNFPKNAVYYSQCNNKTNIAPFELTPWLLGQCATVQEAMNLLSRLNLWNKPFSKDFPLSPLHWILADPSQSITIEPLSDGMRIYENPVGILTNNPPFDFQMQYLAGFMNLTAKQPENRFSQRISLLPYSLGMGAMGLPGDLSSPSRFVKAAFTKLNSISGDTEDESVSQFFHILGSVAQQRGLTTVRSDEYEITLYSSCCNTARGIYYYTTYSNRQISAVNIHHCDLDGDKIVTYPLVTKQQICMQN